MSYLFPTGTDHERGGFWRRAFALLIDLIIVCLLLQTIAFVAYPMTGGRIQFKDGLATLTCNDLDKVPDGVTVPADLAPTSIKICRQGLFALTAARIVIVQHFEPHGPVTTFRQIVVQVDEEGHVVMGLGLGVLTLPLLFGFRLLLDLGRGTPGRRICRVRLAAPNGDAPPRPSLAIKRYALQALPAIGLFVPAFAGLFGFAPKLDPTSPIVIGATVCMIAGLGLALHTIIYRKETFYDRLAGLVVLRVDHYGVVMPRMTPGPSLLPPEIMGADAPAPAIAMPPPLPEEPARNYFAKHWRGQYSLPFAYWVNGTVLGIGFGLAIGAFAYVTSVQLVGRPMLWFACMLAVWLLIILLSVWQVTGIWRSATRYRRSERYFWGGVAKCMMVFASCNLAYRVIATGVPQLRDIYGIARGDPMVGMHRFRVADDGARLDFVGGISFGVAQELDEQLAKMDHVTTVLLNSQGGRILEAQRMADVIRRRGLSTTVTNICASACTIAFLGGKERTMTATAKIGFHQPNFGGLTDAGRAVLIAQEEARLQRFGLSKDFAVRANQAPPQGMWYPDKAELLREHVVTGIIEPQPKSAPKSTETPTAIATVPVREPLTTAPPIATLPPQGPPSTSAPRASIPADVIERLIKHPPAKGGVNAKTGAQK